MNSTPSPEKLNPLSARALAVWAVIAGSALTFWPFHLNDGRFAERLRLSKVLMNRGDFDGARVELEKALSIEPANTVVEFNLGLAEVGSHRATDGIAHLRQAVDRGVPVPGARYALANALIVTGDTASGAELVRTFTPAPEDDAESCVEVAKMAINVQAPAVAERYLVRAEQLRPGWQEPAELLGHLRGR
jgi:Flp pilus assembly protein TadD